MEETTARAATLLPLASIVELPEMQLRGRGTDAKVVEAYRRALGGGAVFPPITVARVEGAWVLVDGFHRVAALRALHRGDVEAVVLEVAGLEEARWRAAQANMRHGQRLKPRDLHEAFRAYVKAGQHRLGGRRRGRLKSYREMAADLPGVHHTTLRRWLEEDAPATFRALQGGEEKGRAPGGLPDVREDPGAVLAGKAQGALDAALAALPGVTDGVARKAMLERAEALVAMLRGGPLEDSPF